MKVHLKNLIFRSSGPIFSRFFAFFDPQNLISNLKTLKIEFFEDFEQKKRIFEQFFDLESTFLAFPKRFYQILRDLSVFQHFPIILISCR